MGIKYRSGYKYQLAEAYRVKTAITPPEPIIHDFFVLSTNGTLTINAGYAWDGCSGAYDDRTNMRAGLVHDAFFQLMREGLLDISFIGLANKEFQRICLEDGMNAIRAWCYYRAVSAFGKQFATPQEEHIMEAP